MKSETCNIVVKVDPKSKNMRPTMIVDGMYNYHGSATFLLADDETYVQGKRPGTKIRLEEGDIEKLLELDALCWSRYGGGIVEMINYGIDLSERGKIKNANSLSQRKLSTTDKMNILVKTNDKAKTRFGELFATHGDLDKVADEMILEFGEPTGLTIDVAA